MVIEVKDPDVSPSDAGVKSATRVLDVLEHLARWGEACTHAEIADSLGIPKSSLTHLLRTLVGRGYLTYTAERKGYMLGPKVADLAKPTSDSRDLLDLAIPALERITSVTRESSSLNVLRGDRSEVVASQSSSQRLVYQMRVGDTAPLYATSGGKAILAHLPPELLEEYLSRVAFQAVTPNTITNVAELRADLDRARTSGIATVREEFTPGIAGLAVPILGPSGYALASLNVAVPVSRMDDALRDLCIRTLKDAASSIKRQTQGR